MAQSNTEELLNSGVKWVTMEKCAELVGWTKDAIVALRTKGHLRAEIHWIKRNGRVFINMVAFQKWIETGV